MTKREYLESIGYKYGHHLEYYSRFVCDKIDGRFMIMCIDLDNNEYFVRIPSARDIDYQRQIDDLQIAFNNVKRDFEEMQKYED